MEKMKINKLALALATTLGLGVVATSAQAINIAENGVGDFAYIPYFSVTKAQNELIEIVNTSNKTVAAKIVFRRGTDSAEVRDFVIILSPKDVWNGVILPTFDATGAVTNARIYTNDKSCTVPHKTSWTPEGTGFSVAFDSAIFGSNVTSSDFISTNVISGFNNSQIRNIKEGYVSVALEGISDIPVTTVNSVAYLSKHVNGTPRDCAAVEFGYANQPAQFAGQFLSVGNVLRVSSIMIDGASNLAMGVPVTTLANAFDAPHIVESGRPNPIEPEMSRKVNVFESSSATLATGTADVPERAVSAVLMNDSIYGTYDFTGGTKSSWVVTLPTKRALMALRPGSVAPFKDSVVPLDIFSWDNEEAEQVTRTDVPFSPFFAVKPSTVALPYEVNVVNFTINKAAQNPLASLLGTTVDQVYAQGWMQLGLTNASNPVTVGTSIFKGIPAIGFEYFENGGFSAANSLGFSKLITK